MNLDLYEQCIGFKSNTKNSILFDIVLLKEPYLYIAQL